MSAVRPDPDALLARVQREEAKAKRGKLKVFFGATAGVGKTYAMLEDARALKARGVDVVVGYVEPHGRAETEVLLEGLERLPYRQVAHRGAALRDFDLDAALARKPRTLLVDELAHSNPLEGEPRPRHAKRWQDVEELLEAGIAVHTTVNVQHVESLNDIVAGITGVRMQETVPDSVFERADEVVMIDTPPDVLLERLQAGKVYIPEQARNAIENFFRKGNLIALRELAMRTTARRVARRRGGDPRRLVGRRGNRQLRARAQCHARRHRPPAPAAVAALVPALDLRRADRGDRRHRPRCGRRRRRGERAAQPVPRPQPRLSGCRPPRNEEALARLRLGRDGNRGLDGARRPHEPAVRAGEHRDGVPAGGGAGRGALRPRPGDRHLVPCGGRV